ncbi:MAG: dihydroneopterin aldolase [Bacteroidota bacterium]|nr:dihydroneopterin aldolase [Bacteroidota bacterium]
MLTTSLHHIKIAAPIGLHAEEALIINNFEIDVDISFHAAIENPLPYADYSLIQTIVKEHMQTGSLIEHHVQAIYKALKATFTDADKIKVCIRKMHPPLDGEVRYAQVCFEH